MSDFLGGLMARRMAVLVVIMLSQCAGLTVIAIAVAAAGHPAPGAAVLPYAPLAGPPGGGGVAGLHRRLAVGKVSVRAPVPSLGGVVPGGVGAAPRHRAAARAPAA